MVRFDEADDAPTPVAVKCLLDVVLVVGDEVWAVGFVGLRAHRDVVVAAQADLERIIDFLGVVVTAEICEGGFGGRLQAGAGDGRLGEGGGGDVDAEEAGEVGNGADGGEIEAGPGTEVADIPPKVGLLAIALVVIYFGNKVDGGVGTGEVFGDTEGFGIVVYVA